MRIDILTLFPDSVGDVLSDSILGRAQDRGIIRIEAHQIRDYTANKQNQTDDYPYGGGRGAVMTADPLYRCWEAVCDEAAGPVHTIYMSPCGRTFKQADAIRLSKMDKYPDNFRSQFHRVQTEYNAKKAVVDEAKFEREALKNANLEHTGRKFQIIMLPRIPKCLIFLI